MTRRIDGQTDEQAEGELSVRADLAWSGFWGSRNADLAPIRGRPTVFET